MTPPSFADLAFFKTLSRVARQAVVTAQATGVAVEDKGLDGFDPVTDADKAVEEALSREIARAFPDDAICGEEFGGCISSARRRWSIDPIDGTRAFLCGLPSWSVLVGLVDEERHHAGMIDLPSTNELFIAVDGRTSCNGLAVQASGRTQLSEARLSTTDPFLFLGAEFEAFDRVRKAALVTRYGLDGSAYARLAASDLDLVIESGLKPHDYDALIPVVRGAGGHIGDWVGGNDFASGRIVAAATEALYRSAVGIMDFPL